MIFALFLLNIYKYILFVLQILGEPSIDTVRGA